MFYFVKSLLSLTYSSLIYQFLVFLHLSPLGYSDLGVSETPLLYVLSVTRCKDDYCEDFCVYKGSSPEHSAFLPPGFSSARNLVALSITVEDHQGAAITALNKYPHFTLFKLSNMETNWLTYYVYGV